MPVAVSILWKPLRDSHYVVASLQPGGGGLRQLFVQQSTLREIQAVVRRNPEQPVVGLLVGQRFDCSLTLTPYVLIASHVEVVGASLDEHAMSDAIRMLRGHVARRDSIEVVGWYSAGPSAEAVVGRAHAAAHSASFEDRWQTALIFGEGGDTGAFFLHDSRAARWFHAPFYEVTDSKASSRAPKPTCVSWPAYLTTATVVPLVETAPPAPLPARPLSASLSGPVFAPLTRPVSTPLPRPVSTPPSGPVSPPLSGPVSTPLSGPVSVPITAPLAQRSATFARPVVRTRRTPTREAIVEGFGRAAVAARRSGLDVVKAIGRGIVAVWRLAANGIIRIRAAWTASVAERRAEAEAERVREAERRAREAARRRAALEEAQRRAIEDEKRRGAEAEARRAAEAEARRKAAEEAERRRAVEAEARRKAAEEAERLRIAEAEAAERRRVAEAEEAERRRILAVEEAERRRIADAEEAERRRAAEAEARRKAAEEAEQRRVAEAEARRQAAEAEAARQANEAEVEARRQAEEAEAKRAAEAEAAAAKRAAEAEAAAAKRAAEAEAQRKAAEEAQRRAAEDEARRTAIEEARRKAAEEGQRKAAEEEQRRAVEAQARRQAAEAEARRLAAAAEAEVRRQAAEAEARRLAATEAEARRLAAAEAEARRLAEAEAKALREAAAAEARRFAEAEAQRLAAEDEAERLAEEAELEARRLAEEERAKARRRAAEAEAEGRRKAAEADALRISVEVAAIRQKLWRAPVERLNGDAPKRQTTPTADFEDTTASDGPYRYLALAGREGFEVSERIERGNPEHPETVWLLHEAESGLRLIVVTTDEEVREASLHYNLRTEDDALLRITPPEHRDLDSRTIYAREACLHDLRARCRRLRATGALERNWKVSPTFQQPVSAQ
jgi:hypothetical protein